MSEDATSVHRIVIIGGSFAGQSAAHYIFKHVARQLEESAPNVTFVVNIVDTSSHFWWRLSAPRAIVTNETVPHDKSFVPIPQGFANYNFARVKFEFTQAECTGVDFESRSITVQGLGTSTQTIPYYALIIASGTRTPTPLTSLQGPHTDSVKALDDMQQLLASGSVKHIVIGGGGPVGVETAGELGEKLNGTPGFFSTPTPKVKITLVAGSDRLLLALRKSLSAKAETLLRKVGVDVIYGARVKSVSPADATAGGSTTVVLDNGTTLAADVYIPAAGVKPNSSFLPASVLTDAGYVVTNKETLRVEAPGVGPRVYCVGDVGSYTRGGAPLIYNAVPVLGHNFTSDVLADLAPNGSAKQQDKLYSEGTAVTQVVPVGRKTGVGEAFGWQLPSFMIAFVKGRDYMLSMTGDIVDGKKW